MVRPNGIGGSFPTVERVAVYDEGHPLTAKKPIVPVRTIGVRPQPHAQPVSTACDRRIVWDGRAVVNPRHGAQKGGMGVLLHV